MFTKILIANRGEIACRIIKTAASMGIKTVAIYSSVDKDSLHVRSADSAYCIGDAAAKDSYLNIEAIIRAAQESRAEAIHPGYGFLSENPEFAKACKKAGLVFIGPSVEAMQAMASKQLAKKLLEQSNVPLIPGYHGSNQSEEQLLLEAKKIGFPVLIKAANGGGGKGMRAVDSETEFSAALAGAKREAMASFADETMIIEKLLLNPRHVEVQIMADNQGQVLHLFERDCSIQRRHQKIIEEAPAPDLSAPLRQKLANAACEVADSIKYSGAGTVEFLVDSNEHFYFMEMNTRLQVEHPVTELITGLDLVAWQLIIAANEPLPLKQEQIKAQGHAFECRIYAEDPFHDFIPSIGKINFLKEPSGDGIRIDTGIECGSHISQYYDPMIAKLIAWGPSRQEALQRLEQALAHYFIGGVKTNIPFLQAICQDPDFAEALVSTDFLTKKTIKLARPDKTLGQLMAISFDYLNTVQEITDPLLQDTFAWQAQQSSSWVSRYQHEDEVVEALITPLNTHQFKVRMEENEYLLSAALSEDKLIMDLSGVSYQATVDNQNNALTLYTSHGQITLEPFNWTILSAHSSSQKGTLTAPMPATVAAVLKNVGDAVKKGDCLLVLEAMKMEHSIYAPNDGVLSNLFYSVGDQVHEGAELLSLS